MDPRERHAVDLEGAARERQRQDARWRARRRRAIACCALAATLPPLAACLLADLRSPAGLACIATIGCAATAAAWRARAGPALALAAYAATWAAGIGAGALASALPTPLIALLALAALPGGAVSAWILPEADG